MKRTGLEPPSALELVEEAFCLLRAISGSAWVAYCIGGLPFVLGFLFFWSDMARSAFAEERLLPGSLALALGFIWMKTWQAWFALHLLRQLGGSAPPQWSWRGLARTALAQAAWQPLGLFLLPLAAVLFLPFAWVQAFFTNATVLGGDGDASPSVLGKRAWRQACVWPAQNHELLLVLAPLAVLLFANWVTAVLAVPFLLDRFLGIESVFTRAPWAALNSTLGIAVIGLAYLCFDPLHKALYVLRCFYGEALASGQDLKAELRRLARPLPRTGVLILLLAAWPALLSAATDPAGSAPPAPRPATPPSVSAPALRESIERVLHQREYSWRLPRESQPVLKAKRLSWIDRFNRSLAEMAKSVARWLSDLVRWLRNLWTGGGAPRASGTVLAQAVKALVVLLVLGLLGVLGVLLYRLWRGRVPAYAIEAEALPASPDLADENVGADRLPGDEWLRLARELSQRGELRLALRALYLSSLARLAERQLILLARFKSNRDYERELSRRGHALAEVLDLFSQNLAVFERVWYGLHPVSSEMVDRFAGQVDRLRNT